MGSRFPQYVTRNVLATRFWKLLRAGLCVEAHPTAETLRHLRELYRTTF
jgi:hypothetical protein